MSRLWSDFVAGLEPYVPGAQGAAADVTKLNTNENPYPPSPRVQQVLQQFDAGSLRLYPPPESDRLRRAIAKYHGVNEAQVFVGNGSDEVLAHAFNALFRKPAPLLSPDHSYSFYPVYCQLYNINMQVVPLDNQFRIDVTDYYQARGGVVFANPNAPTGLLLARSSLRQLLGKVRDCAVLVDEAYMDFASVDEDLSALPLLQEYDNLLITRTLSKSHSLAGLRLGYALGSPGLIEALVRVKNSFNSYPVDALASALAIASFEDAAYCRDSCRRIIDERNRMLAALRQRGFESLDSAANFVMARHTGRPAGELYEALLAQKVWVRYFDKPRIRDYLRITVGSPEQNDRLFEALDQVL